MTPGQFQGEDFRVEMFDGHSFQAFGDVRGRDFFFHAQGFNWTFEVANDSGKSPADGGFDPEGAANTEYAASWFCRGTLDKLAVSLAYDEGLAIIQKCVRDYRQANDT